MELNYKESLTCNPCFPSSFDDRHRQENASTLPWPTDTSHLQTLPNPSATERASVASQMHQPPQQQWTGTDIYNVDNTYRLRKVLISSGGRIIASWKTKVLDDKAVNAKRPQGGGQIGHDTWHPSCIYAWAIVRTRGAVGDVDEAGTGAANSGAIVSPSTACVISQGHASSLPTYSHSHSSDSPPCSRWQHFEVDSTGWLPGDSLSLWILTFPPDHQDSSRSATTATAARGHSVDGMATSNRGGRIEEEGAWKPTLASQQTRHFRPCVQEFKLRRMDDAREDAIAGRTCSRSRTHRSLPRNTASGGAAHRKESEGESSLPVGTGDRDGLKENGEDMGRWLIPPRDEFSFMDVTTTGCSWA